MLMWRILSSLTTLPLVFGPVMMGTITYLSGNPRLGILSVALLFFAGMFFFRLVNNPVDTQSD